MTRRFVLASASDTRLRVLRQAGFDPEVIVSGVDEDATGSAEHASAELAIRKAQAVAVQHPDAIVLGCDSLVEHDGRVLAKPEDPEEAASWWRSFSNSTATVWTGQAVVLGSRMFSSRLSAMVHFDAATDAEIDAYIATGEPMGAAGAFRLDGRAAAFITAIEGDPGTVHGVSVAAFARALMELDVEVTDLWV